jgi:galactosamine-6-phosphate isomerase
MLRPVVFRDHEAASRHAADWLVGHLREKPESVLCLATGTSPMRAYALLCDRAREEPSLVDRCRIVKLDEWGGLAMDDPSTCEHSLRNALVRPLELADRYAGFESRPADAEAECARVASWLEENGPIDVCVLGLGLNGHIGFNEPAAFLRPHSHVAQLSDVTLTHAMVSGHRIRPTFGLTLGVSDLLQARHILMIVTGAAKREALARLLSGRIATDFPASLLGLHGDVQLVCDEAAVEGLRR